MSRILTIILILLNCVSAAGQINTDQVMDVGRNALYFEDYMLSIQYFNRVIEAKPYLARPYFFRSIAKLNLDDYRGAEEDATAAIERNPYIADAYEVRGVALQNQGKTAEAIADYDKALQQLPGNRGIMFNKALAQEELGQLDEASTTFDELIANYPGFDNAYVARARISTERGDTVSAMSDLQKAIEINKNNAQAYVMRADISIKSDKNYRSALDDINEAIRLQPRYAGLYINRAYLRYNLDDYFGAMDDYDYALVIDPVNSTAYFNRGLLRAEVNDNDRALEDFTQVLRIDPNDMRARYNRAMIYSAKNEYQKAIDDLQLVSEAFPEFSAPIFAQFELYDRMGDRRNAMRAYDKARELARKEAVAYSHSDTTSQQTDSDAGSANNDTGTDPAEIFANKFTTLITIDAPVDEEREYNNKNIRGKVQDRNVNISLEAPFFLSYYSEATELSPSTYYMREADEINTARSLRFILQITNSTPQLSDETTISRHFNSIEYYNSWLATHTPRAIDYFGRAMDQFTLRNYSAAIEDLDRAIAMTPDFSLAYFLRAGARSLLYSNPDDNLPGDELINSGMRHASMASVIDDYNTFITLSPLDPFAHFNLGNIYAEAGSLVDALEQYTKAIELKSDFGEAFYNRGYVYFRLGNREAGTADLSRAGELGILPSYILLKRMSH